ncbi:MAG: outer membrane protein assembly factor BamA [Deltaproteobacteria bacterium]|nr:MAG: outer membrane protein assembly factor BamA [Deltaproteobacteria bacterium]
MDSPPGSISEIEFVCPLKLNRSDLIDLIGIEPGDPYSQEAIDKTIEMLWHKGLFSDIVIKATVLAGGIKLTYLLTPRVRIKEIEFKGNRWIPEDKLLKIMGVSPGEEFYPNKLKEYQEGLRKIYEEHGCLRAGVRINVKPFPEQYQVSLQVNIEAGEPCQISKILFPGNTYFKVKKLQKVIPLKTGGFFLWKCLFPERRRLDRNLLRESVEKLREFYRREGFWEAVFSEPEVVYDLSTNQAAVYFPLDEGERFTVLPEKLNNGKLEKIFRLEEGESFCPSLLEQWKEEYRYFYQKKGYLFSEASYEISPKADGGKAVRFYLKEGNRVSLRRIKFVGNHSFSDKLLRKQMLTRPPSILGHLYGREFNGIYLEDRFQEDLKAVVYIYRKEGFLDAQIEKVEKNFDKNGRRMDVTVSINEGVQTLIREIEIQGNRVFSTKDILRLIPLKDTHPLDFWAVEDSKKSIIDLYLKNGFLFTGVKYDFIFSQDRKEAKVKFIIEEGPLVSVAGIVIQGNDFTKDRVIRRELLFETGEPCDPEKIALSQQRLYRLGFFKKASIKPIIRATRREERDFLVNVKEKKCGAIEFGFGYGTGDGLRGFAEISHKNLEGSGRSISLRGDISYFIREVSITKEEMDFFQSYLEFHERKLNLGFREPWLFDYKIDARVNVIDFLERNTFDTYDLHEDSVILGLDREIARFVRGSIQYRFSLLDYLNIEGGEGEPGQLGILSPILIRDTRNDLFYPTRGTLETLTVDFSSDYLGSESEFLKCFGRFDLYFPLYKRFIAAFSLRAGYGFPFGESKELPLSEKFRLGGSNSLRGFKEDSLGPGDIMLSSSLEIRFPLFWGFGGTVFSDEGNVWEEGEGIDIRDSAGFGLRYITPIGPLRFDLGFKLDKRKDEGLSEWHFFIGNIF